MRLGIVVSKHFLELVAQCSGQRVFCANVLRVQFLNLTIEDVSGVRQLRSNCTVCLKLERNALANTCSNHVRNFVFIKASHITDRIANKRPRTWSSKRTLARTSVKVIQVFLKRGHITNNIGVDIVFNSPVKPIFVVHTDFVVQEAVSKRLRHTIRNTLIALTVTSSSNHNVVGQLVATNCTVENQLVSSGLRSRCSTVKFVKEEDNNIVILSHLRIGQFIGRREAHLVCVLIVVRVTFEVSGFPKRQAAVDQFRTKTISFVGLADAFERLGLTNAGRTPNHHRTLRPEVMLCILGEFGQFNSAGVYFHSHNISPKLAVFLNLLLYFTLF